MSLAYIIVPIVVIIGLLRKCRERTWGRCKDTSSLEGRVFLVTGANSGIGKETVRELVKRKARVIMACRNMERARNAVSEIRKETTAGEMVRLLCISSKNRMHIIVNESLRNVFMPLFLVYCIEIL